MVKFLNYLKGVIQSPQKTFNTLVQDSRSPSYLIWLVISLALVAIINKLIPQKPLPPQATPVGELINQFIKGVSTYSSFLSIPIWIINGVILHSISRMFSKAGSFNKLLVCLGFIGLIGGTVILIFRIIDVYVPMPNIGSTLISLWLFYLTILAVSSIYSISKKKGFSIVFAQTIILVLIFMVAMFVFVLRGLK